MQVVSEAELWKELSRHRARSSGRCQVQVDVATLQ